MGIVIKKTFQNRELTFEDAYSKFYKQIYGFFCQKISNKSDAEDLTVDVFTYCYKNWAKFDPEKASLSTWIYLIARSRYKNYCRDHKEAVDIDEILDLANNSYEEMEQAAYVDELRTSLSKVLEKLSDKQRFIVVMRYFEGMDTDEIANHLQITPNNVRVQLFKALKRMKLLLEEEGIIIDG